MYDSGTEGDLILWLIHYYLTLDHEITDKSPARFHLKLRHLLWYDTPLADSMLSTISPPWQATCSFCEPSENSTTCSFSTIVCHLHLLKTPPPGDSMPPAAAQMRNLFVCSRESLQLASWCNNIIQYPALHFKCNRCDQITSNCAGNRQTPFSESIENCFHSIQKSINHESIDYCLDSIHISRKDNLRWIIQIWEFGVRDVPLYQFCSFLQLYTYIWDGLSDWVMIHHSELPLRRKGIDISYERSSKMKKQELRTRGCTSALSLVRKHYLWWRVQN